MDAKGIFENFRKALEITFVSTHHWRRDLFIARKLLDRGHRVAAEKMLDRLIAHSRVNPAALQPTVRQLRRVGRLHEGLELADEFWDEMPDSAEHVLACARVWYETGSPHHGDVAIARAKVCAPDWVPVLEAEALNQRRRGNTSVSVEAAKRIIDLTSNPRIQREWERFIGEECFKSADYADAAEHFLRGLPKRPDWEQHYRLALSLERSGDEQNSEMHYRAAERKSEPRATAQYRRAALHLRAGSHGAALEALPVSVSVEEGIRIRVHALMMLGYFAEVAKMWERLPHSELLGEASALALELQGDMEAAAERYREILADYVFAGRREVLLHRHARAATRSGLVAEAVAAEVEACGPAQKLLSEMGSAKEVDPAFDETLSLVAAAISVEGGAAITDADVERLKRLACAASTVTNVVSVNRLLGRSLAQRGDMVAAANRFLLANPFPMPNAAEISRTPPRALDATERYSEVGETVTIDHDVILYESFQGMKTACNPLAICRALLEGNHGQLRDQRQERDRENRLQHVWVIRDDTAIHPALRGRANVHFVQYGSVGYRMALATAGRLVNNTTFPSYFVRRQGQRYLNTWHGIPWKHLGRDIAEDPFAHENAGRNFLQATDIALPDEHTAEKLLSAQDTASLAHAEAMTTGSPRVDWTLGMTDAQRTEVRERVGLLGNRPTVLYAPTWRGSLGSKSAQAQPLLDAVQQMARHEVDIIFRAHPIVETEFVGIEFPANVHLAPAEVDTNELLGVTDILVTDYSSVIFDFAPRGRPIITYAFDLDEYVSERGLYFDIDEVPGITCTGPDELDAALSETLNGDFERDWRGSATARLWEHEDGNATARVLSQFFDEEPVIAAGDEPILISAGGLRPNGVTRSLRSLVASSSELQRPLQLFLPRKALLSPQTKETARELHGRANISQFTGLVLGTRQEQLARAKLAEPREAFPPELLGWVRERMQRERSRHFGRASFSAVVDFDGYLLPQAALFAVGFPAETRNAYMIHSDFLGEAEARLPRLRRITGVLGSFNAIGSVSEEARDRNRDELHEAYGIDPNLHYAVPNTISIEEIRAQSRQELDDDMARWLAQDGPHVVIVGRLSVEKNHADALEALSRVVAEGEAMRLLIVGDGPTHQALSEQAEHLGVGDYVFFTGHRANPYPAIAAADALLLPSLHEGQGLVLIEAMSLGTPVIAAESPGPASVLDGGRHGMLVPADVAGLTDALRAVCAREVEPASGFDPEEYQRAALRGFGRLISQNT